MKNVLLGIDIGGTNTVLGFVEKSGNILAQKSIPTKEHENLKKYIDILSSTIKLELQKGNFCLKAIGIGVPNGNYNTGTVEMAPNLNWGENIPLADIIKKEFAVPVKLTNDAKAAAQGEKIYGGAKNMNDFLFITLGTGLGSGIFSNGQLIYGHDGFAGEIGHSIIKKGGRSCGCGRKGCLETYVSATGIKRTVFELLAKKIYNSKLKEVSFADLNSEIIYNEALKGDKIALEAFEITGKFLGRALADAVTYTSPQAIFLYGGLANAGNLILEPAKKYFEMNLLPIYRNKIQILLSEIKNGQAAVLGASALVMNNLD